VEQTMVILDPNAMTFDAVVVFSLAFQVLFKSGSEIHANLPGNFSLSEQIFLHWAAATLKGLVEFQNKKF
jgi:hypothetical protein